MRLFICLPIPLLVLGACSRSSDYFSVDDPDGRIAAARVEICSDVAAMPKRAKRCRAHRRGVMTVGSTPCFPALSGGQGDRHHACRPCRCLHTTPKLRRHQRPRHSAAGCRRRDWRLRRPSGCRHRKTASTRCWYIRPADQRHHNKSSARRWSRPADFQGHSCSSHRPSWSDCRARHSPAASAVCPSPCSQAWPSCSASPLKR